MQRLPLSLNFLFSLFNVLIDAMTSNSTSLLSTIGGIVSSITPEHIVTESDAILFALTAAVNWDDFCQFHQ